jgi:hypothetical protein
MSRLRSLSGVLASAVVAALVGSLLLKAAYGANGVYYRVVPAP